MKAKRLTALALAALMAVSSATVALADTSKTVKLDKGDGELTFGSNTDLYKYDDDEGTLVRVPDNAFQPGDTIYIPLYESTTEKLERGDTFYVHGDFDIGEKWVDDVRFEYRKGEVQTNTSTQYSYSFKGRGTLSGWQVDNINTELTNEQDVREMLKKDEKYQQAISSYWGNTQKVASGVVDQNGNYYNNESDAVDQVIKKDENGTIYNYGGKEYSSLKEAGLNETADSGYVVNGKYYGNLEYALESIDGFSNVSKATVEAGKYYVTEVDEQNKQNFGAYRTDKQDGVSDLNDFYPSEIIYTCTYTTGETSGNYWCTADAVQNLVNGVRNDTTISISPIEDYKKNSGIGDCYWVNYTASNERTLVPKNSVTISKKTTYSYNGNTYSTLEEAKKAAGIKTVGSGYVDNGKWISEADALEKAKKQVSTDFANSTVTINSRKVTTTDRRYIYWVRIDTDQSYTTKDVDVVGTIYVSTHSSKNSAKNDPTDEFDLDITLTNANTDNGNYFDEVDGDITIEDGERAVVSFADDAGELIVEFGDDAWFEFNARGQGKLNLAYNTKFNRDFAYDYDHANIDFINFVAEPTTNKTGTLYIYADEDSYIYEVTSKGAKKINGAYYDDDEGAWVIRTRHLTSYAISDRRLKTIDQMEDDKNSSSSSKPSGSQGSGSGNGNYKPIPDTGR